MAKHNLKTTLILLGMFLLTQFIGLFVVAQYNTQGLPPGLINLEFNSFVYICNLVSFILNKIQTKTNHKNMVYYRRNSCTIPHI
jgi:uncharacterized membrane protein YkgB